MGDVAAYDNRTVQRQAGSHRILIQLCQNLFHRTVQIHTYHIALAGLTQLFRNQFARIAVEFFNPDTVLVNFTFDITVGRARHAQTYRTRRTVTRQTDDTHIVCEVLAAELCTETDLMRLFQNLLFEFHVAECAPRGITRGRQVVIIMSRSQLHGEQVLFGRCAADNECDMIRRTSSRTEALHLLNHERYQSSWIEDGFRLLIQISLIGRPTAFGHAQETVLHSFGGFDVDLCREVALGVHLFVHAQRGILAVTQVFFGISLIDTFRQSLFVAITGPHLLAFFAMDDGRTRILTERKNALACHFRIAQERQRHILVIVAGLRVVQNLRHLFIMRTTQHERHIAERRVCHRRQSLGSHLQHGVPFKLADRHIVFGQQIIFSIVLAHLEHRSVLELRCICHNRFCFKLRYFLFRTCKDSERRAQRQAKTKFSCLAISCFPRPMPLLRRISQKGNHCRGISAREVRVLCRTTLSSIPPNWSSHGLK